MYAHLLESLATQTEMPLEKKNASAKDKGTKNSLAMVSVKDSSIAKMPGSQDKNVEERYPRASKGQPDTEQHLPPAGL